MSTTPHRTDPLRKMLEGHIGVSEWLHNFRAAVRLMDSERAWTDFRGIEDYFRRHVRDHFLFEEEFMFPAVLEVDHTPSTQALVARLREDHVGILTELSGLFRALATCVAEPRDPEQLDALKVRAQDIIDRILAHSAEEDDYLVPILQRHLDEITVAWSERENTTGR